MKYLTLTQASNESCSPHSCAQQLLRKAVRKAAPQNYSRNLLSKLFPEVPYKYARKLLFFKIIVAQSCFGKLVKIISQTDSPKLLPKVVPKISLQSDCPKAVMLQTYFSKWPQSYSPKWFPKATPPKLLPKASPQNYVLKLFPKVTPHSKLRKSFYV